MDQDITLMGKSNNTLFDGNHKAYLDYLGLSTPGEAGTSGDTLPKFINRNQYFVTINLSPNSKLYSVHDKTYGIHFWWNLTQSEQLRTLKHNLKKFDNKETRILACFEQTRELNIHCHMIIDTNLNQKTLAIKFFDYIYSGVKTQKNVRNIMKYFIDIKVYDHSRWNDYFNKYGKTYQTLPYPLYTNTE